MSTVYFLVQQMMFFSIPLLVVALGGMFSERSGVCLLYTSFIHLLVDEFQDINDTQYELVRAWSRACLLYTSRCV